jgi:hypothetical protein
MAHGGARRFVSATRVTYCTTATYAAEALAYQEIHGSRRPVAARYVLRTPSSGNQARVTDVVAYGRSRHW